MRTDRDREAFEKEAKRWGMDLTRDRICHGDYDYSTVNTAWRFWCDGIAHARAQAEPVASFQARVDPWMQACFGPIIAADCLERGDRLIEEVLELLQSGAYPAERVAALTDYVWSRPAGEPVQEVGGVMVTLAAYCLAHGLNMHEAGETELARIWTKVEKIRAKQAAKPTGSALPQAWPTPPDSQARQAAEDGVVYVEVSGLTGTGKSAVIGEIEIALKSLGLATVHDAEFQAEKNATHADWQAALDLYRPRIVLQERNIPRTTEPLSGEG